MLVLSDSSGSLVISDAWISLVKTRSPNPNSLVAPDRGEDRNDHDRNDDREAALGAGDLLMRFVICGACA